MSTMLETLKALPKTMRETWRSFSLDRFENNCMKTIWNIVFLIIVGVPCLYLFPVLTEWMNQTVYVIFGTPINNFIFIFTFIMALAVFLSWWAGGIEACKYVALMLNIEIILYTVYSEKWGYIIEMLNFLVLPILSFFESPQDRKEREEQERRILSEKERQEQIILIEEEKAKEAQMEIELNQLEMFKGMYNKMFGDFKKKAIVDTKQDLQRMEFSWQTMVKNALKDEVHKNKNEWALAGLEGIQQHVYESVLVPFRDQMLVSLEKMPEVMDIELSDHSLGEICDTLEKSKPKTFEKDRNLNYLFKNKIAGNDLQLGKCTVNLSRLSSIASNLLGNSNQAGSRKHDVMLEKKQKYCKSIELAIEKIESKGQDFLSIQVRDNCGGIEDGKLADIYKKPIISSSRDLRTGGERKGEGTVYVGFFVDLMGGEITARNYVTDDGHTGAETKILLPIKYD